MRSSEPLMHGNEKQARPDLVVSNAGPLISLSTVSRLDLLRALFGEIAIFVHCDHEYLNFRRRQVQQEPRRSRGASSTCPTSSAATTPTPALLPDRHRARDPRHRVSPACPERNRGKRSVGSPGRISSSPRVLGQQRAGGHTFATLSACLGQPRQPHAVLCLQALRRQGARTGRAGRRGPGAAGQGRGRLRDGGRAVQRLQVPPLLRSGHAWARPWAWPARPTATHSLRFLRLRSVHAWTARRPGSRSRRTRRRRRRACT
jgi:hypothetical protein